MEFEEFEFNEPVEVSLAVDSMSVTEDAGKALEYTFTRADVDASDTLTIDFSVDGTATFDEDYTLMGADEGFDGSNGKITFAQNETTATVTITPKPDTNIESDETVKLTVPNGSDYIIIIENSEIFPDELFPPDGFIDDPLIFPGELFPPDGSIDDPQISLDRPLLQETASSTDESAMVMGAIANDDPMLNAPWAKQFNGDGDGYEYLAVDGEGNTYVTGDFENTVTVGNKTLTPEGDSDVFIAKYNKDGIFQWAEGFGDTANEEVEDITVDNSGNTYFTGTSDSSEGDEVFVTKFNKDGTSQWRKDFGNGNETEASGIEVDAQGNTYITGEFQGQLTFSTSSGSTVLDGGQFNDDVFVAKLNSEGNVVWAQEFGDPSFTDEAEDVVVDKDGNSYLFMTEGGESSDNAVVTKLDKSNGSELWKQNFNSNNIEAEDIAIDNTGNTYITGEFENTVTFGNTTLEGGEDGDIFVAKLDSSNGNVLWAKDLDSQDNGDDVDVEAIAVDEMGNTYVTGSYGESMSVGNFMLYDEGGESGEGEDAFIAKFDSQGEVKWAQNLGGMNAESISDIAVNDGKIHIAGGFYEEANFGDKSLTTNNTRDTFLVKLEEQEKEKPEVSLAVDSNSITEGTSNQITYTFTRTGEMSAALTVDFTITGSATFNEDYTLTGAEEFDGSKGKVTFKAGEETATVTLSVTDDPNAEQDETLALNLAMGTDYMVSTTDVAANTITITSDDKETIIGNVDNNNDDSGNDDDEEDISLISNNKKTFKFKSKFKDGKSKSSIKFSFKSKSIEEIKEIGFFSVDDDEGTIDGISPDDERYIEAALNRAQSIFSVLGNAPQGFDTNIEKILEFSSDTRFRFLSVKNGTIDGVKKGKIKLSQVAFSSDDFLEVSDIEKNSFDLDFEGVKIKMKLDADTKKAIGSGLQEKIEVLDLRSEEITTKQTATFTVNREAAYDNFVGFFKVTDENGGIDIDGDGTADVLVGQAGYAEAAIQNRIAGIDLSVGNQSTQTFEGEFEPGSIFVPFLIVDGTPDAFTDIYFPFLDSNSDGADHVMMLADNVFGFEDLAGGGDRDFNDIIVKIDFN